LHIYGHSKRDDFHQFGQINILLKEEYGNLFKGLLSFGQDIFGNQFSFDLDNGKIVFFDIETADKKIIANNFSGWTEAIINDLDYYTGHKIAKAWINSDKLTYGQRLSAKIPFILGGNYALDNLFASDYPKFIKSAASIAMQVHNLPDGTPFKINIKREE
jgi:hypothetical protein